MIWPAQEKAAIWAPSISACLMAACAACAPHVCFFLQCGEVLANYFSRDNVTHMNTSQFKAVAVTIVSRARCLRYLRGPEAQTQ